MSSRSRWTLGRDGCGLGILVAGSLGIGLTINGLRSRPLPLVYASPQQRLGEMVARMPAEPSPAGWRNISLGELEELVSAHRGRSIDARPEALYRSGHVPGALNIPRDDFERAYSVARAALEPAKERPVVVYCSEADCQDSELVAGTLGRLGYRHLYVYKEGWEEWSRAGLPQEPDRQP